MSATSAALLSEDLASLFSPDVAPPPPEDPDSLSWNEICARCPDAWVVLVDLAPTPDSDLAPLRGKIFAHHPTPRAAGPDLKAARARHQHVGAFWTGDLQVHLPWPSL